MSDDLAGLLDEQDARHTQLSLATTQVIDFISVLARDVDFATASLEEREEVVTIIEALRSIETAAKSRRSVIEQGIVDAGAKLVAKEFRLETGSVRLESRSAYVVNDAAMHDALTQLIALGDLTKTELDEAVKTVISYHPDHRRLNALLKRGGRVQQAIEANRTKEEGRPSVRVNRKGGKK